MDDFIETFTSRKTIFLFVPSSESAFDGSLTGVTSVLESTKACNCVNETFLKDTETKIQFLNNML